MNFSISIHKSKTGRLIPKVNDKFFHSVYNPIAEADKIIKQFESSLESESKNLIVFGLGFGYHIEPLLKSYEKIIIFEPIKELIIEFKNNIPQSSLLDKTEIISDINRIRACKDYHLLLFPPTKRMFPDYLDKLKSRLNYEDQKEISLESSDIKILLDYPIYGGSYTTAEYVQSALENLGYKVKTMDNGIANNLFQRILSDKDLNLKNDLSLKLIEMLSELYWSTFNEFKPHICLFMAQSPITIELLRKIKEAGITTAFWFVEDYKRFPYWQQYASQFDLFCCIQKGDFFSKLKQAGSRHTMYLPMAADELRHRNSLLSKNEREIYGSDVSFMGAGYPNRHALFNQLVDYDLKIWGNGWESNSILEPFIQKNGERVSIEETAKIYSSSKININLHSSMDNDFFEHHGDFVNPRTFEILSCEGFQLVDKRLLLSELLVDGEDLVTFDSIDDLKNKINYYLKNEKERKRIARNGFEKVRKNHTYKNRMAFMLDYMLDNIPSLRKKLNNEKLEEINLLKQIDDSELEKALRKLPDGNQSKLDQIIEILQNSKKEMDEKEAAFRFLDSFRS